MAIEPTLQPLNGEEFAQQTTSGDENACLIFVLEASGEEEGLIAPFLMYGCSILLCNLTVQPP